MIKKISLLVLVILLAIGIVACSSTAQQESASADTAAATQAAQVAASAAPASADAASETAAAASQSSVQGQKAPKNGSKYVIGVSLPAPDNQWVAAVIENAKTQAENNKDAYDIIITTANNPSKQVSDVEDMLIKNPDAMVIFPIESAPLTPIAEEVKSKGIPLLVLTRGIESENYDTYIRGDDRSVGIAAAHYIGKRLNGKGNVVMMQASPSQCEKDRTAGFNETIAKYYPELKVIATGNGEFARDPAMKAMENILQANPKIDAVFSEDDEQALGCIQAIKSAGRESEMFVTGVGGNKSVLELLKNNDSLMGATFFYSPLQGGSAVKLAELLAQGKGMSDLWEQSVPREIIFTADTITSENAALYYNPDSQY